MTPARAEVLGALARRIDAFNAAVGAFAAWLGVATVVLCFLTVYLRYALGVGYTWMQESYIWTHVVSIMLGSGFALLRGGFVRVDMLYVRMSRRQQAAVDVAGTALFMAPFLWMMASSGWGFFFASWKMRETSQQQDGLPALYALKAMLLAFVVVVALQGLAMAMRALVVALAPAQET